MSNKKSYMNTNSLLSEGIWDDFKSWIRSSQVDDLSKKKAKLSKKYDKKKTKLQKKVDNWNASAAALDAQLKKDYPGIKLKKRPKLSVQDFEG